MSIIKNIKEIDSIFNLYICFHVDGGSGGHSSFKIEVVFILKSHITVQISPIFEKIYHREGAMDSFLAIDCDMKAFL